MRPSLFGTVIWRLGRWGAGIAVAAMLVCAIFQFIPFDPKRWPMPVEAQQWLASNNKTLMAALSAVSAVGLGFSRWVGPPWFWQAIREILNKLQSEIFDELSDAAQDDHRVTLYKYRGWHWLHVNSAGRLWWPYGRGNFPWSGWMAPISHSGKHSRRRTVFLAAAGRCEGVCGTAYFHQSGTIDIQNLPDLHGKAPGDRQIKAYADSTFVSAEWVRKRLGKGKPCARSFRTLRLEVKGEHWGVIMIDSRSPTIPRPQIAMHKFNSILRVLEILLKQA